MSETIRDDTITVGTTSIEISTRCEPGERVELSLVNVSPAGQVISLAWGQDAVANAGVVLFYTGTYSASKDQATTPSNVVIKGISSAAGGLLAIHERRVL